MRSCGGGGGGGVVVIATRVVAVGGGIVERVEIGGGVVVVGGLLWKSLTTIQIRRWNQWLATANDTYSPYEPLQARHTYTHCLSLSLLFAIIPSQSNGVLQPTATLLIREEEPM
jgi:hypothetical protein